MIAARDGEQIGDAAYDVVNRSPSVARRSTFGVRCSVLP
jgi:hypothetical protein